MYLNPSFTSIFLRALINFLGNFCSFVPNDLIAVTKSNEEQSKADLKASAKAKLIAGEALTEDEANTIVL